MVESLPLHYKTAGYTRLELGIYRLRTRYDTGWSTVRRQATITRRSLLTFGAQLA